MSRSFFNKRVVRIAYTVMHKLVRCLSVVAVLLVCAFVFLRVYGVPKPILQMVVERVNAAGIPIHIEALSLTLRGWQADGVSYYSRHPDDLDPLFQAGEVLFARKQDFGSEVSKGWKIDFSASDVSFTPSVEWGVSIPDESAMRHVDHVKLSVSILPDRVEFKNAEMSWSGIDFHVDGTLVKERKPAPGARGTRPVKHEVEVQETVLPVYVSVEQFQSLENHFKQLDIEGNARVDVHFSVDMNNYAKSSLSLNVLADEVNIRDVEFDGLSLNLAYAFPALEIKPLTIDQNGQHLTVHADYNLESGMIRGQMDNSITSSKLLLLMPQSVLDLLVRIRLQIDELPAFSLAAGPAKAGDLLNSLSGSFSVRDLTYCGLLIEAGRGNLKRTDGFLDITDVYARVQGQEHRADEFNSCMQGGAANGRVFWDANHATFGVEAEGSLDPNLLIEPLSMVRIATNVIDRFSFPAELPQISLSLGSCYTNWSTFYIDISGVGHDVGIHEGLLSTANISGSYSNAILKLDPIAVMDGVDFMKGEALIDFRKDTVFFDAFGSIHPALVEDAVWPYHTIFGDYVKTAGKTEINARGTVDWGTMEKTDFRAEVEAEVLEVPVAKMDQFKGTVIGAGPKIHVTNAVCALYGGSASGSFDMTLAPGSTNLPYLIDFNVSKMDVQQMQQHLERPPRDRAMGLMTGYVKLKSDFTDHYLAHAEGRGSVSVEDGELADLPIFAAFSNVMRKVMPGFNFFSITSLRCDFTFHEGLVKTENAVFMGDLFSASATGHYSHPEGYDANVRVNVFSNKGIGKVIRVLTSPVSRLFEMNLTGTLDEPVWRLKNFTSSQEGSDDDSD